MNFELSKREEDVIALIARGYTNKEVGTRLFISKKTVDKHRCSICRKLRLKLDMGDIGCASLITHYAIATGLVEPLFLPDGTVNRDAVLNTPA
jgi:DNA-binding NarL/FixJ family response regulator